MKANRTMKRSPASGAVSWQRKMGLPLALAAGIVTASTGATELSASVNQEDGAAWFEVNGRLLLPGLFYGGYKLRGAHPEESVFARQIKLATQAGVQILSSEVDMPWMRNGEMDFSVCDRILDTMHEESPEAFLFVRFGVSSPEWWNRKHPEDCAVFADGTRGEGSLASPLWKKEMLENADRFIAHCERKYGDRIVVYQIGALENGEWFYPGAWEGKYRGFDRHTPTAFRKWAVARYGSFEKTKKAWRKPGLAREGFRVPSLGEREGSLLGDFRDPQSEQFVMDFNRFQNEIVADTILSVAAVVKKKTGRRKLVSAFYGYLFDLAALPNGPVASGHYALDRLLASPDVDLIASPISYGDRALDGISAFMSPVDSIALRGKLWMVEDDTRTWLCRKDSWPAVFGMLDTIQQTRWVIKRNFGQVIPRRLGIWQMDLIDDGWYDSEPLWETLAELRGIYGEQMRLPKTFSPEIAVVVDMSSPFNLADSNKLTTPLFSAFRSQLYRVGAPCAFYLLSDIVDGRAPLAKVNLFLGAWSLNDEQRQILKKRLRGKTAVWFHGSGYMNGRSASEKNMSRLTGFEFEAGRGTGSISIPSTCAGGSPALFQPLYWETRKGQKTTKAVGQEIELNPRWTVKPSPQVQILAKYTDGPPAMARRSYHGFESIYAGTLGLPAGYLRKLCKEAGVHIYVDSDDVVNADRNFLSVSASNAGEKGIHLPFDAMLSDLESGKRFSLPANRTLALDFAKGETRLFSILPLPATGKKDGGSQGGRP